MAYATQQDIIDRGLTERELGELADDDNVGKLDDAAVQARILGALNEASATVDAYCRQRYAIPLQASDKVKAVAVTIAMHALFARRRRVPQDVKDRYDEAIAFLKDVAAGKAALDQPTGATPQSAAGGVVETQIEEKFSDGNIGGFV